MKRITCLAALMVLLATAAFAQSIVGIWIVTEMQSPDGPTTVSRGGTNMNFLANGRWEFIHATGATEAGTYKLKGSVLNIVYESGELFGDYKVSFNGGKLQLTGVGGTKGYGFTMVKPTR